MIIIKRTRIIKNQKRRMNARGKHAEEFSVKKGQSKISNQNYRMFKVDLDYGIFTSTGSGRLKSEKER